MNAPNHLNNEQMDLLMKTLLERMIRSGLKASHSDTEDNPEHLKTYKEAAQKIADYTGIDAGMIVDIVRQLIEQGVYRLKENGHDIDVMPIDIIIVLVISVTQEEFDELKATLCEKAQERAAEELNGEITGETSGKVDPDVFDDIFEGLKTTNN